VRPLLIKKRLFEEGRRGRNLECEDSALNESTKNVGVNSQKEFIYTSSCNLDLRESRRNNHKDSDFTKPNLGKTTGRRKKFNIFRRLQWIFQKTTLFF